MCYTSRTATRAAALCGYYTALVCVCVPPWPCARGAGCETDPHSLYFLLLPLYAARRLPTPRWITDDAAGASSQRWQQVALTPVALSRSSCSYSLFIRSCISLTTAILLLFISTPREIPQPSRSHFFPPRLLTSLLAFLRGKGGSDRSQGGILRGPIADWHCFRRGLRPASNCSMIDSIYETGLVCALCAVHSRSRVNSYMHGNRCSSPPCLRVC